MLYDLVLRKMRMTAWKDDADSFESFLSKIMKICAVLVYCAVSFTRENDFC